MANIYDIANIASGDPMGRVQMGAQEASAQLEQYKHQKDIIDEINKAIADAEKKATKNKFGWGVGGSVLGGLLGAGLTGLTGGAAAPWLAKLAPYMSTLGSGLGSGIGEKLRQEHVGATDELKKLEKKYKGRKQYEDIKSTREGMESTLDEMVMQDALNSMTMDMIMPGVTKAAKESGFMGAEIDEVLGGEVAEITGGESLGQSFELTPEKIQSLKDEGFKNVDEMFGGNTPDLRFFKPEEIGVAPEALEDSFLSGTATKGPYAGQQYNIMDERYVDYIDPETGLVDQEALLKQGSERLDSMYENFRVDPEYSQQHFNVALDRAKSLSPELYAAEISEGLGGPGTFNEMYPEFAMPEGIAQIDAPNPFIPEQYAQFQPLEGASPAQILTSDPSAITSNFQGDVGSLPFDMEGGGYSYETTPGYSYEGTPGYSLEVPLPAESASANVFGFNVPITDASQQAFAGKAAAGQNILSSLIPGMDKIANLDLLRNPMLQNLLKTFGPSVMGTQEGAFPRTSRFTGPTFRNPYGGGGGY